MYITNYCSCIYLYDPEVVLQIIGNVTRGDILARGIKVCLQTVKKMVLYMWMEFVQNGLVWVLNLLNVGSLTASPKSDLYHYLSAPK